MSMSIGKLESVELRELWKHEERDFSVWLENNIEALSEALNIKFNVVERERPIGSFQADLLAEDSGGNFVIIENQLDSTNHDHLGKIITYLTNIEAKTAIWVTSHARPEHIRAISWLNETTPVDVSFYLVKLAAYRIGDSGPAPLFTVIVEPSKESKAFHDQKKGLAQRHLLRLMFWGQLLEKAKSTTALHAGRSPTKELWLGAGAGKAGLVYAYLTWLDKAGVELYIDTGDGEENKNIFDMLHSEKDQIEADFGDELDWDRMEGRRGSRIRKLTGRLGLKAEEDKWPEIQDEMIDAMDRLSKALKLHIQSLRE